MKLPKLPKANAVIQTGLGQTVMFSANQYTEAQMLQFQRDTVEACAKKAEEAINYYWPNFPESSGAALHLSVVIRGLLE